MGPKDRNGSLGTQGGPEVEEGGGLRLEVLGGECWEDGLSYGGQVWEVRELRELLGPLSRERGSVGLRVGSSRDTNGDFFFVLKTPL